MELRFESTLADNLASIIASAQDRETAWELLIRSWLTQLCGLFVQ